MPRRRRSGTPREAEVARPTDGIEGEDLAAEPLRLLGRRLEGVAGPVGLGERRFRGLPPPRRRSRARSSRRRRTSDATPARIAASPMALFRRITSVAAAAEAEPPRSLAGGRVTERDDLARVRGSSSATSPVGPLSP